MYESNTRNLIIYAWEENHKIPDRLRELGTGVQLGTAIMKNLRLVVQKRSEISPTHTSFAKQIGRLRKDIVKTDNKASGGTRVAAKESGATGSEGLGEKKRRLLTKTETIMISDGDDHDDREG